MLQKNSLVTRNVPSNVGRDWKHSENLNDH